MAKKTHQSKQLELPVLLDVNAKPVVAAVNTAPPVCKPAVTLSPRAAVSGVKKATPEDLSIYDAISGGYFREKK